MSMENSIGLVNDLSLSASGTMANSKIDYACRQRQFLVLSRKKKLKFFHFLYVFYYQLNSVLYSES